MFNLSIVIISKNEEKHIKNAIESIILASADFNISEIVLVDSASTDKTVDIAKNFPIKIIQIQPGAYMSPSAGRHIGLHYCQGDYVFFLDGDMTVDKNWFSAALPILVANSKLAAIAGLCEGMGYEYFGNFTHLGGAVLYRRDVLKNQEIGSFQPYLSNEEELELGFRISKAGYQLQRINIPMTVHCTEDLYDIENDSGVTFKQIIRSWHSGRYAALGQVLRLIWNNPYRSHYLKLFKRPLLLVPFYFLGLISLFFSLFFSSSFIYFLIWFSLLLSLFIARTIWKRNLYDTFLYFIDNSLSAIGFVIGWFNPVPASEQYQPELLIVKK